MSLQLSDETLEYLRKKVTEDVRARVGQPRDETLRKICVDVGLDYGSIQATREDKP